MKDFNFFEPYLYVPKKNTRNPKRKSSARGIIKVVLIMAVAGAPIFVFGSIFLDNKAINEMNAIIESPEMQEALSRVDEKRTYVNELQKLQKDLIQIHKQLVASDIIRKDHLTALMSSVPENVNIESIDLASDICSVSGTAFSRDAVAELEYNLRKTKLFDELFVKNITGSSDAFSFVMQFSLMKVVDQ